MPYKNKEDLVAYRLAYKEKHKDKIKAYKLANKEKIAAYNKEYFKKYRADNLEKLSEYLKGYRETNLVATRLKHNKKGVEDSLTLSDDYVKNNLYHMGFKAEQITAELIELKRITIKTKRLCRQLKA